MFNIFLSVYFYNTENRKKKHILMFHINRSVFKNCKILKQNNKITYNKTEEYFWTSGFIKGQCSIYEFQNMAKIANLQDLYVDLVFIYI